MRRNAAEPGVIQLDVTLHAEAMHPGHLAHEFVRQREMTFVASVRGELELEQQRGRLRDGLNLDIVARLITSQIEASSWPGTPSTPSTWPSTLRP